MAEVYTESVMSEATKECPITWILNHKNVKGQLKSVKNLIFHTLSLDKFL